MKPIAKKRGAAVKTACEENHRCALGTETDFCDWFLDDGWLGCENEDKDVQCANKAAWPENQPKAEG